MSDPQQFSPEPVQAPIPYTREFVVDAGYATRVSRAVVLDLWVRRPTMYIGIVAIVLAVLLVTSRPDESAWLLLLVIGVLFVFVLPVVAVVAGGRALRKQAPVGSRFRSGFASDRFVIDGPSATSALAYSLYRGSRRKGEFVYLRMRANRRWVAFPGQLFGDEDLARFPQV